MSLLAYTFRQPVGFPGDVQRADSGNTIESQVVDLTTSGATPYAYGLPLKIGSNSKMQLLGTLTSDTAALLYGFNVRPYPVQATNYPGDALGTTTPPSTPGVIDVLRRGYIVVQLNNTTAAAKGSAVYVRVNNATGLLPLGGIEAAAGTGLIALTNAIFEGPADSNGYVTIAFNI